MNKQSLSITPRKSAIFLLNLVPKVLRFFSVPGTRALDLGRVCPTTVREQRHSYPTSRQAVRITHPEAFSISKMILLIHVHIRRSLCYCRRRHYQGKPRSRRKLIEWRLLQLFCETQLSGCRGFRVLDEFWYHEVCRVIQVCLFSPLYELQLILLPHLLGFEPSRSRTGRGLLSAASYLLIPSQHLF